MKRKLIQKILIVAFAIVMMIAIPFKTNAAKGTPGGENGTTETTTEKPGKTTESTTESTTEPSVLKPSQPPAITEEPSTDEEPGAADSQEPTTEATTEETTKPKNEDRTVEEKTESDDKKIVASKGDPDKDKEGKGIPTTFIIIGVCALVVIIALIVVIAVLLSARKKNSAPVTTVTPDIPPNDFDDTLPPIPPAFAAGAADGNSGVLAGQAVGAGSGILAAGAAAAAVNAVRPDATVQAPGSLPIQLDIYNGESPTGSRTLYMAQDLIIGSGPNCDIIFSEPYVSGQNTRIFLQNGTVMIEDMNSTNGTYAAGLRVNKAAPLKSGDVISIGEAEFCLKF